MGRELLFSITKKDLIVQTFRSGGKGGQHQNKKDTGVRIIHKASGARGEARDSRSQRQNKNNALNRLVASKEFKNWHKIETARRLHNYRSPHEIAEEYVEKTMRDENLLVEYI